MPDDALYDALIHLIDSAEGQGLFLYDLPQRRDPQPKIYGLSPDGHEDGWVEFDHIDGMYGYCIAYDGEGNELGVCHLKAWIPLVPFRDGYRFNEPAWGPD